LVLVDVERVRDYILSTRGLAQMRGASRLLAEANELETVAALADGDPTTPGSHEVFEGIVRPTGRTIGDPACDWELVFAGGALAQAVFRDEQRAARFRRRVAAGYRKRTGGVRAVSSEPVPLEDLDRGYGAAVAEAVEDVVSRKDGIAARDLAHVLGGGFLMTCSECGAAPVSHRVTVRGSTREVCDTCRMKEERGRTLQRGELLPAERSALEAVEREMGRDLEPPRTIDDLAAASRLEGYVGYIEADGDRMGEHLRSLQTKEHYRVFSESLEAAIREAWIEAVSTCLEGWPQPGGSPVLPVSLLIAGGDDVLALSAAHLALPLAEGLCRGFGPGFEREIAARWTGPEVFPVALADVSMSAGVFVAPHTFPFSEFQRLGKELQSEAKASSRTDRAGGVVDFHVSSASSLASIRLDRARAMTLGDGRRLHNRPYRVADGGLRELLGSARELGKAPRGKLHALEELLALERRASEREFAIALSRMGEHGETISKFLHSFPQGDGGPWIDDESGTWTPVKDLVEVAELVR
jgi:hypothetical protein